MENHLSTMWAFLSVGLFTLIGMCMLDISALINDIPQGWFVFFTMIVVLFSCAMFVAAFVAAVEYIKEQLRREMKNINPKKEG